MPGRALQPPHIHPKAEKLVRGITAISIDKISMRTGMEICLANAQPCTFLERSDCQIKCVPQLHVSRSQVCRSFTMAPPLGETYIDIRGY